jgi:hypothetical protein
MMIAWTIRACMILTVLIAAGATANAEVSRIEITSRSDVLGGKNWGTRGPYEKLSGTVTFAVDPKNPFDKSIPNIDKAPRDAQGKVEFSSDITILAPKDRSKANGVAFFEASNRGRQSLLAGFDRGKGGSASEAQQYGDGTLLNDGFTLVWVGWQFSVAHRDGLIATNLPIAMANGHSLKGKVTSFGIGAPWIPAKSGPTLALDPDLSRYPPADLNAPDATLTVAENIYDTPKLIPRDQWQFATLVDGQPVPNAKTIYLKSGFLAGERYDITYTAQDTPVGGLGYAAIRDLASAIKYRKDMPVTARYEYIYGSSQTGRFLREYLYDGFNADEQGRKTFDAVWAHLSGSARGDFVQPFSTPDGLGIFTGSMFPFSDLKTRDPATGKEDGLLMHMSPSVMPKVIYTNTETEYVGGGRAGALVHTSLDGKSDLKLPDNVRVYMWAGAQHGPAQFPPGKGIAQQMTNPNDYYWGMRAVFAGLDGWVRKDEAPPPSRYPHLSDGSLVAHDTFKFPAIPGVQSPAIIPAGYRADLGSPLKAPRIPYLNPQVDADGNDIGGVRMPEIEVPLATYTGWNFRAKENGAPNEIIPLTGSFIPFAPTKAERLKNGDPRLSIAERYPSRAAYLGKVKAAAQRLVKERYLLAQDVDPIVSHAGTVWDGLTAKSQPAGGG